MGREEATKRLAEKYTGKDSRGRPKGEYVQRIAGMDDKELSKETREKIWLSAYANNNPCSDYHWHVDACYDEWEKRDKLDEYSCAYEQVKREVS